MLPSFNGIALGFLFSMNPAPNPNGRQINTYPGQNGLEVIDQGSRGGTTLLEAAIIAAGPAALASAEQSFRALVADGGAYTLVDQLGTVWTGVILAKFTPKGRVLNVAATIPGVYIARKYDAEFLHIY